MVKFLEHAELTSLSGQIADARIGDRVLSCTVDVFSCKRAGTDKKTGYDIQQRLQEECDIRISAEFPEGGGGKRKQSGEKSSSPNVTMTELGDLAVPAIQRFIADLILTLNTVFPDYDFTDIPPTSFRSAGSVSQVIHSINGQMNASLCSSSPTQEVGANRFQQHNINPDTFLPELWEVVASIMPMDEVQVYTYVPEVQGDPFSDDGVLWSFNYFFCSRKEKKILYFTCITRRSDSAFHTNLSMDDTHFTGGENYMDNSNLSQASDLGFEMDA
mmetsp:Transcript_3951/g.7977  ORF Transcript_3951/g.7977 Transcript_3951/m.7977 type:complete len:273 (+) Transcript_3951:46-864(+)